MNLKTPLFILIITVLKGNDGHKNHYTNNSHKNNYTNQ